MARYDTQEGRDTQMVTGLDRGFRGVNMRVEPELLDPSWVSEATNMRFRFGVAETRGGFMRLNWMQKIDTGTTPASIKSWGVIQGMSRYSDPTTSKDYLIVIAGGAAYAVTPNNIWSSVSLPAGETIPAKVTFTQCFNVLIMWRGELQQPLTMTGVTAGFKLITPTPSGLGVLTIPNADRGIFVAGRLWTFIGDTVYASDIQDYTRYSPFNTWRVNQGTSDGITAIAQFNDDTIVIFKSRSIYALTGVVGATDGSGNLIAVRVGDPLTTQYGCTAPDSIQQAGSDIYFYSHLGVMSLRQTEQNKVQSTVLPISDAIQPLVDRINASSQAGIVSGYWDSRYYLAVPLDAAEGLRDNRMTGLVVTGAGPIACNVTGLTIGRTYRWIKADTESQIVCGATTLTSTGDFVATATTAAVTSIAGDSTILSQLYEVFKGVNTAVLVYDFVTGAWAGMDQASGIEVKAMSLFLEAGRERLFVSTPDGWIYLYEEGFEDQVAQPYSEVRVTSVPAVSNTIQVNAGATITATASTINTGTTWGCNNLAAAQQNIWSGAGFGYSSQNGTQWNAPNTWTYLQATGIIRFYGTNGLVPTVVTTGSWATVIDHAYQGIQTTFVSRGYALTEGQRMAARWANVHIQTLNPSYTIDAVTDGVVEQVNLVTDRTKSRVAYYRPWDASDWDPSNTNDDWPTPYREDYALVVGSGSGASSGIKSGSGLRTDLHQETVETFPISIAARAVQVKVVNSQGRIRIMRTLMEGQGLNIKGGIEA